MEQGAGSGGRRELEPGKQGSEGARGLGLGNWLEACGWRHGREWCAGRQFHVG